MSTKTINISLPEDLVKEIDKAAKASYTTRSNFIRESVMKKLHANHADVWGDEGSWRTIADFRDLPGGGLPAAEFLAVLRELDGQSS
jgi:hypothetical protein